MALLLAIPATLALGVSIYLGYVAFTKSTIAGCGGGLFDCNHVLNSKWSSFLGLPVAVLAAATYVGMLLALAGSLVTAAGSRLNRIAWMGVVLLGFSAGLAALWFISLQVFEIGHFCKWCLTAHACGLVISLALLIRRPFEWKFATGFATVAASGLAVLIAVQANSPEPQKFQEIVHEVIHSPNQPTMTTPDGSPVFGAPIESEDSVFEPPVFDPPVFDDASVRQDADRLHASLQGLGTMAALLQPGLMTSVTMMPARQDTDDQQDTTEQQDSESEADENDSAAEQERRLISIHGGAVQLDVRHWPLIGKPDAKYVFVEMFDYACPHCRNTHRAVDEACRILGDDVAIIVLPLPLNRACNDAATTRDLKFSESCEIAKLAIACWRVNPESFETFHSWMFEGSTPNYRDAKSRVDQLVGKEAIDKELAKKTAGDYIAKHVLLYKTLGRGNVPKLLFPGTSIVGEYTSGSSLADKIRREAR